MKLFPRKIETFGFEGFFRLVSDAGLMGSNFGELGIIGGGSRFEAMVLGRFRLVQVEVYGNFV